MRGFALFRRRCDAIDLYPEDGGDRGRRLVRTCRSLYRSSPSRAFSWLVTPMTPKYTALPHTCATLSNRRDVFSLVLTKSKSVE